MKSLKLTALLLVLVSSQFFTGCTKESVDFSQSAQDMMVMGDWKVDYYLEGSDKTAQYDTYEFNFLLNGTLDGRCTASQFHGKWVVEKDVNSKELVNLSFDEAQLSPLMDQWKVISTGSNTISLQDAGNNQLRLKRKD